MKKLNLIWTIVLVIIVFGCSKDSNLSEPKISSAKQITNLVFSAANNSGLTNDVAGRVLNTTDSITAILPEGTDIKALSPTISVSKNATVSPAGVQNFTNRVIYTVTAEDKSTHKYYVFVHAGSFN